MERITTMVPFPRGLAMVDGDLYVLCRGRVRGAGGVSAEIDDQAGTIYRVDPEIAQPVSEAKVSDAVRANGEVFARPTDPPFRLWKRRSVPPEADVRTDRPYCTLRYHEATQSFYLCAFSGIDQHRTPNDRVAFSKNRSDAILRYDLRTNSWREVERHRIEAGRRYPHARNVGITPPPHGFLNGPDNCLVVGNQLYAASKDNSLLVRYDLGTLVEDPNAGPPGGEVVLTERVEVEGLGSRSMQGQSALGIHEGWLYVGYRTTSEIIRIGLDEAGIPVQPIVAQLVAQFDPFDPVTLTSANLTDLDFDEAGRLYVVSAQPARIFRFSPDPDRVFDARAGREAPWADLASITGNPRMKSENVLWHEGWLYVTSGDGYDYQEGADGTVYRIRIDE
jgi:hypothetical protein